MRHWIERQREEWVGGGRLRGGRTGGSTMPFSASRRAMLASLPQPTERHLKGHYTVGFRPVHPGIGEGGITPQLRRPGFLLYVCRERRSVNLDVASMPSTPQGEVLNPRFRGKSTRVTCFSQGWSCLYGAYKGAHMQAPHSQTIRFTLPGLSSIYKGALPARV